MKVKFRKVMHEAISEISGNVYDLPIFMLPIYQLIVNEIISNLLNMYVRFQCTCVAGMKNFLFQFIIPMNGTVAHFK